MVDKTTFKHLIKIASALDQKGLHREADKIDHLLRKVSMTIDEAFRILPIPLTGDLRTVRKDVQEVYKQKALENHPDRGGSEERMRDINVARDVILEYFDKEYKQFEHTRVNESVKDANNAILSKISDLISAHILDLGRFRSAESGDFWDEALSNLIDSVMQHPELFDTDKL